MFDVVDVDSDVSDNDDVDDDNVGEVENESVAADDDADDEIDEIRLVLVNDKSTDTARLPRRFDFCGVILFGTFSFSFSCCCSVDDVDDIVVV